MKIVYQNLCYTTKAREIYTLSTYITKEERFKINYLSFYLKKLDKKNTLNLT